MELVQASNLYSPYGNAVSPVMNVDGALLMGDSES